MPRALVLYSGSLASTVAAKLLAAGQGWEIDLLYVRSPFFGSTDDVKGLAQRLFPRFRFRSCSVKRGYLTWGDVVQEGWPFPCGACRYLLFHKAAKVMQRKKYDLLVTGEIVGKGGLGKRDLLRLDRAVGLQGKVFRPLSAALLPPVELAGDGLHPVPRLAFKGEAEEELRRLALDLSLPADAWDDSPACSLRDAGFAARVLHLLRRKKISLNAFQLLKFRHVFATPDFLLVVALSPEERKELQHFFLPEDVRLYIQVPDSPLGLVRFLESLPCEETLKLLELCGGILAALGGYPKGREVKVSFRLESSDLEYLFVYPAEEECLERLRLPRLNSEVKLVYLD